MKFLKYAAISLAFIIALTVPAWWYIAADREDNDPDLPPGSTMSKADYMALRDDNIALLRGLDTAQPGSREKALREVQASL